MAGGIACGRYTTGLLIVLVATLLTACGGRGYIPVQDLAVASDKGAGAIVLHYQPGQTVTPTSYIVQGGDTLFAIAWRYGWDYKMLAARNNIAPPYTIYVGQEIVFGAASIAPVKPVEQKPSTTKNMAATTATQVTHSSQQVSKPLPPYQGTGSLRWQWPLKGALLQTFNSQSETSKGVDIAASPGSDVRAAAAGQVVYAGNGIQGYGNLLIIKHNDTYLSAYAYNSQLLASEADIVKMGQVIAESGKGPQLDGRLHFEIRKNGKPVNPQAYIK